MKDGMYLAGKAVNSDIEGLVAIGTYRNGILKIELYSVSDIRFNTKPIDSRISSTISGANNILINDQHFPEQLKHYQM